MIHAKEFAEFTTVTCLDWKPIFSDEQSRYDGSASRWEFRCGLMSLYGRNWRIYTLIQ
jgi:hypothetical protein